MAKKKERKEINSSTAKQKLESLTADISLHIEPKKKKKSVKIFLSILCFLNFMISTIF